MRALASHQCGPGLNPGVDAICGLTFLLVLSLAPRGFSPGTPVFPSPQKPIFPNSNSTRNQVDKELLCGCATFKSLLLIFLSIHLLFKRDRFYLSTSQFAWGHNSVVFLCSIPQPFKYLSNSLKTNYGPLSLVIINSGKP